MKVNILIIQLENLNRSLKIRVQSPFGPALNGIAVVEKEVILTVGYNTSPEDGMSIGQLISFLKSTDPEYHVFIRAMASKGKYSDEEILFLKSITHKHRESMTVWIEYLNDIDDQEEI